MSIYAHKGTVPPRGNALNTRINVPRVGTVPDAYQFFSNLLVQGMNYEN